VLSRRLGISLGVDVVPYKTCTFECVYCECGKTTEYTISRAPFFRAEDVNAELNQFLDKQPKLDYITFSGGGEPTLNSDIGKIINFIKGNYPGYKIALITNSSLLWREDVINDIKSCDLILPSLDAVSQQAFQKINHPYHSMQINEIINGLIELRRKSKAAMWLEIFIIPGLNDGIRELNKFKKIIKQINPDKIQLNTLDRPGVEKWVVPASKEELEHIKEFLEPLNVKIIKGGGNKEKVERYISDIEYEIISTLKRRPCTKNELANIFNIDSNVLSKYLHELEKSGRITPEIKKRGVFYKIRENGTKKDKKKE
jgi:wyosine [tRNA(Phe)-imidazoG37] synthetase (radical SAM superfamily)